MKRALGLLAFLAATARADNVIDSAVDADPAIPAARAVSVFPDRLRELWLEALDRPEADLRLRAAQAVAAAHARGMADLDAAVPALVRALDAPDPAVRLAAARAIVVLDARDAAPALLKLARAGDAGLCGIAEPALARWDHPPARPLWLERLATPGGNRVLAVRCLAAVREERAIPDLRALVLTRHTDAALRLAAARALGEIRIAGGEADARQLTTNRLTAALLLRRHSGDDAVKLLAELARDGEPAVAVVALTRLIEIDPKLIPGPETLAAHRDAEVRRLAVGALGRDPSPERIRLLADRLDDPHFDVRAAARQVLRPLALRDVVNREASRVLAADGWRGQEQAAILLAQTGHAPASTRLADLLPSARPEVGLAAAWALRRLSAADALPAALDHFRSAPRRLDADRRLSQLAQWFGVARHAPADAALRQVVPRPRAGDSNPPGPETRAAAIWALGLLHEGSPPADLARAFERRLRDVNASEGEEDVRVRRASAVSLGRMRVAAAAGSLKMFWAGRPTLEPVNNACGWAVARITGEATPSPGVVEVPMRDWFLAPLERSQR